MTKLAERSIDELMALLDSRHDAVVVAKERAARADFALERMKRGIYNALRKSGGVSIEDAKSQAFCADEVVEAYNESISAERAKDEALYALDRIKTAIDLYRTEQSTLRSMR